MALERDIDEASGVSWATHVHVDNGHVRVHLVGEGVEAVGSAGSNDEVSSLGSESAHRGGTDTGAGSRNCNNGFAKVSHVFLHR